MAKCSNLCVIWASFDASSLVAERSAGQTALTLLLRHCTLPPRYHSAPPNPTSGGLAPAELNPAQSERLQSIAASSGVNAEELAQSALTDFMSAGADEFESAATRLLNKNRGLYQRLAK